MCQIINVYTPKKSHYLSSFKLAPTHFPPVIHQFQIQVIVVVLGLLERDKSQYLSYLSTSPYIPRRCFWLNKQWQAIYSKGHTYNEKNIIIIV
jgi:hypothetical protein